ncbi:MAG: CtsR family transcriptional regulator [Streptococcaceae bacterium]|jgi:transcriptional regulator CtsR|nr:CtsR family transcriptional regulator [Streptococcaceae bacterium]
MSTQNTSDMIERYLLQLLADAEAREIEIQRAELAERFAVVPSQINYVIKTRFNPTKGYDVESKRGGGGYIKIVKFHYSAKHELLEGLYSRLPAMLSAEDAQDFLQVLFDEGLLTENEGNLLLAVLTAGELSGDVRSGLVAKLLQKLDKEDGN